MARAGLVAAQRLDGVVGEVDARVVHHAEGTLPDRRHEVHAASHSAWRADTRHDSEGEARLRREREAAGSVCRAKRCGGGGGGGGGHQEQGMIWRVRTSCARKMVVALWLDASSTCARRTDCSGRGHEGGSGSTAAGDNTTMAMRIE